MPIPGGPGPGRPTRRPRRRTVLQQVCQSLSIAVLATVSYLAISHFFLQSVTVVGRSMTPTLGDSQHYLLNRWVLYFRSPHRGEVVVIRDLIDNSLAVKRVVAVPGDTVDLKDGSVYLNHRRLDEPYLPFGTETFAYSKSPTQSFHCSQNQYFVLGDNRMNSADSRVYGPVPRGNIVGLIVR
jgi:signal peptidase I